MKKHSFKLEALLRVRKMKEDLCKVELGKLQLSLKKLKDLKKEHLEYVEKTYLEHNEKCAKGTNSNELSQFSYFITEKKNLIKKIDLEVELKEEEIKLKVKELAAKSADSKLMNKLRDKSADEHKRIINKKTNEDLEELTQNWNQIKDSL